MYREDKSRMAYQIEAQAHLAAIITSSDDAIISKDLNGNITSWNPAAERIFGYTSEEAVGRHISLIIPQDRMSEEDYILSHVRQGKRIEHFEAIRRTKDGRLITLSITVSPIKKGDTIIGISKVARDITALKNAERASSYLAAIIESSDDGIISKDLNGFVTSWNSGAERIFGFQANEIVGRHITLLIPSERLNEEDLILGNLKQGKRIEHFETMRRHKSGRLVPVSLTVSPIRDSAGTIIGASKVARNITDRVEAETALKEIGRKKDEFLANMSHELRTPMNAVIGLTNLLQRSTTLSLKDRKYIDTLKISADNLMELINDLLDFAKIESGAIEIERVEFNLPELVERAISMINVRAREKNLKLYVNYAASLNRYFMGDPLRVHQILMNLMSNAVKFTEQGSIEVDISGADGEAADSTAVTIKVSDTGIGIAENKLVTIFDKFVQADSSITRRFGGSGLGLAITKALADKMGGTIKVESQVGVGTTFIITVPFVNSARQSSIESFSVNAIPTATVSHKNVLLVEDYEPNVLVASDMLEALGYDYDTAHNGMEAVRKFMHGKYDVILMDVQMHDVDGLEATQRIRRIEAEKSLPHTPIIAMTAHVREQDKEKCLVAGMDDFIPKPFDPAVLKQKMALFIKGNEGETGSRKIRQKTRLKT